MKKKMIFSGLVALSLFASGSGVALAGSDNHLGPGVPGRPNCYGQTMAFFAQFGAGPTAEALGIGNLARHEDLTVQEIRRLATAACMGAIG